VDEVAVSCDADADAGADGPGNGEPTGGYEKPRREGASQWMQGFVSRYGKGLAAYRPCMDTYSGGVDAELVRRQSTSSSNTRDIEGGRKGQCLGRME